MDRIEKDWTELDAAKVDFSDERHWTWGRGGLPLNDWDFFVSYTPDDLNAPEVRYKLPHFVTRMMQLHGKWERDDLRRDIRRALGL